MKTHTLVIAALFAAACSGADTQTVTPESTASAQPTTPATQETSAPTATPTVAPTAAPTVAPTATPSASASSGPTAGPPDAARGEKLFADNHCDGCHGTKAKPGKTDIFTKVKWTDDEKKKGINNIKKGKSPMPAFGDKLTDAQIADLMLFITTPK
jgi:mono/diheme cytochrome c family protein